MNEHQKIICIQRVLNLSKGQIKFKHISSVGSHSKTPGQYRKHSRPVPKPLKIESELKLSAEKKPALIQVDRVDKSAPKTPDHADSVLHPSLKEPKVIKDEVQPAEKTPYSKVANDINQCKLDSSSDDFKPNVSIHGRTHKMPDVSQIHNLHPNVLSIRLVNDDIAASEFAFSCNSQVQLCTEKRKHFHCTLCPPSKIEYFPSKIATHIGKCHLNANRLIIHNTWKFLPCKIRHGETYFNRNNLYHYHCPICYNKLQQKKYFLRHLWSQKG